METEYMNVTIERTKKIALIAHDGKKAELLDWAAETRRFAEPFFMRHRNNRPSLIQERTGLPVQIFKSGPLAVISRSALGLSMAKLTC